MLQTAIFLLKLVTIG